MLQRSSRVRLGWQQQCSCSHVHDNTRTRAQVDVELGSMVVGFHVESLLFMWFLMLARPVRFTNA